MTALIPTRAGRPSTLQVGGGTVYISVHDAWYVGEHARLRRMMLDSHPDRRKYTLIGTTRNYSRSESGTPRGSMRRVKWVAQPDSTVAFLLAQAHLDRFVKEQIKFYAQYGLTPPEV